MSKTNKWVAGIVFLVFLIIAGYGVYQWVRFRHIDGAAILCSFIILSYLLNWINWGDHRGGGSNKDEEGQLIQMKSAKVSYYVLMVLGAIILFVSEGVTKLSEIDNYPLLIVVGLTFVTLPITEFFYKRLNDNKKKEF